METVITIPLSITGGSKMPKEIVTGSVGLGSTAYSIMTAATGWIQFGTAILGFIAAILTVLLLWRRFKHNDKNGPGMGN